MDRGDRALALAPLHSSDDLIGVNFFTREVGHISSFADKGDEWRTSIKVTHFDDVIDVVAIQTGRRR